ncbi:hypothetical protein TSUD_66690 [Trifolium subterraneum]|uniref:IBB domain-containing protein n=1 Tax=Trifolium subterraneum TaxID=3900 RepID=A0A2Z6NAR1_TRISU|nr:hypothetical protein TSUD_66690 [Trifolium subterraneum]
MTLPPNKIESLPAMVADVCSNDASAQLKATTLFREILIKEERNLQIEEIIQSGVVPRFVEFIVREDMPELQIEAAWALTNLASGTSENTKVVIDHGAVPQFVALLNSPNNEVRDQVRPALPVLRRLILSRDQEVLTNASWALSYLSDSTNDKIQEIIEADVYNRLVQLLHHPSASVLIPAVRTVGNIVTGDDMQTQAVIEAGLVAPLVSLLQSAEFDIKKEAAWAITNATSGGTHEQIKCWGGSVPLIGIKSGGSVIAPCVQIQSGLVSIVVNEVLGRVSSANRDQVWRVSHRTLCPDTVWSNVHCCQ